MKLSKIAASLGLALAVGLFSPRSEAEAKTFSDVSADYWAKAEIEYLTDRGIINGYQDGRFGITDSITRAEAAAIIIRSLGWGVSAQEDPGYPDVDPSHWAYHEIAMMKHAGFFAPEGKFEPAKLVTRAEMAEMLVNTFDLRSNSGAKFTDLAREHPAYDAINILATNQITTGYVDGSFRPEAQVTRSEFAVFVARALNEAFRPERPAELAGVQVIYDIEIGDQYHQLAEPMMLRGTWMAPAELFTNMGYLVEIGSGGQVHLTSPDGTLITLGQGEQEVWVGDTLVSLSKGYEVWQGDLYIEVSPILRALERPLVYYPEQRLIRIESPRITAADIKAKAPETIVGAVHGELPYWQWAKRDHDYLLKIYQTGVNSERTKLLQEMRELTEAFYAAEDEKVIVRGLEYYSDHVVGKMDAISRGLEARYLLLFDPDNYAYPTIGKSGALGVFGYLDNHEHQYTVADYSFEHFAERKQELIDVIERSTHLPFERFRGLQIFGAPFTIVEHHADGSREAWAGKAVGSKHMLVTNSNVSTFIHEFGHNWDSVYGDHEEYLAIRGREGYVPATGSWGERIEENFAEDFVQAFMPKGYTSVHKADFGPMTEEEKARFIAWAKEKEQQRGEEPYTYLTVNGASLAPKALYVSDGQLRIQGIANNSVYVWMQNEATGDITEIEIPSNGAAFDRTIMLSEPGSYHIHVGSFTIKAVYLP